MPDASGTPHHAAVTALRLVLFNNGYCPIPVRGKRPVLDGWQSLPVTAERIAAWQRLRDADNTGVRTDEVRAVDIDVLDAALAEHLAAEAERVIGANPLRRIGRPPKLLIPYRAAEAGKKLLTNEYTLADGSKAQVEILGSGQQFVAYGVHPDAGRDYEWHGGGLDVVPLADLPLAAPAALTKFLASAEAILAAAGRLTGGRGKPAQAATGSAASSAPATPPPRPSAPPPGGWPPPTRAAVEDALRHVPNTHDWHGWFRIGAAIWDALGDDGAELFYAWSAQSPKHDPAETRRKWESFRTSPPEVTVGTLFWEARQNGWKPAIQRRAAKVSAPQTLSAAPSAPLDLELSEDGVARMFEAQHADTLRHVEDTGQWLRWTGACWQAAPRGQAFTFARNLIHRLNREAAHKIKISTGRAAFCGGVEQDVERGQLVGRQRGARLCTLLRRRLARGLLSGVLGGGGLLHGRSPCVASGRHIGREIRHGESVAQHCAHGAERLRGKALARASEVLRARRADRSMEISERYSASSGSK